MTFIRHPLLVAAFTAAAACAGLAAPAQALAQTAPEKMVRVPVEKAAFAPFGIPGTEVVQVYGRVGGGVPTAMLSRIDPGKSMPLPHTHTQGYWAVVVAGTMQHWELSEPDRGPMLKPGSIWFQPGGNAHTEVCVGTETCMIYVYFSTVADFTPLK